jgi:E3 ubiquitin-protein ligase CCNP1IP1
MEVDQDSLRRKNEELVQAYQEKNRKFLRAQELYDKMKRQAMLGQVQEAALDAADHTIQASVTANRYTDRLGSEKQRPPPPLFTDQRPINNQRSNPAHSSTHNTLESGVGGASTRGWAGFSSQGSSLHNFLPLSSS